MKLSDLCLKAVDKICLLTEGKGPFNTVLADLLEGSQNMNVRWALVGGLAVGFHAQPRGTQDVDILVASEHDIQALATIPGFKRVRLHALEHLKTGIMVEVLTATFLKIDPKLALLALQSVKEDGIPVVNKEALVALKLQRASHHDKGDIINIIKKNGSINLSKFPLTTQQLQIYSELEKEAFNEKPLE
jgi:hypothetical protein